MNVTARAASARPVPNIQKTEAPVRSAARALSVVQGLTARSVVTVLSARTVRHVATALSVLEAALKVVVLKAAVAVLAVVSVQPVNAMRVTPSPAKTSRPCRRQKHRLCPKARFLRPSKSWD